MLRRVNLVVLLGLIAGAVCVFGLTAGAQTQAGSGGNEVEEAQQRLAGLRMDAGVAYEAHGDAVLQLGDLDAEIAAANKNLTVTEEDLGEAQDRLEDRASTMYKSGNVGFVDVLIGAENFSEFSNRVELWVRLLARERAEFDRVREIRDTLAEKKAFLEATREQRVEALDEADAQLDRASALEEDTQAYLDGLNTKLRAAMEAEQARQIEEARAADEKPQAEIAEPEAVQAVRQPAPEAVSVEDVPVEASAADVVAEAPKVERAAPEQPVASEQAAAEQPVASEQAAAEQPITSEQAADPEQPVAPKQADASKQVAAAEQPAVSEQPVAVRASEKTIEAEPVVATVPEPPQVETQQAEVPEVEAPEVQAPEVETRQAEVPEVEVAQAEVPKEVQNSEVEVAQVEVPEVETSQAEEAPEVDLAVQQEAEMQAALASRAAAEQAIAKQAAATRYAAEKADAAEKARLEAEQATAAQEQYAAEQVAETQRRAELAAQRAAAEKQAAEEAAVQQAEAEHLAADQAQQQDAAEQQYTNEQQEEAVAQQYAEDQQPQDGASKQEYESTQAPTTPEQQSTATEEPTPAPEEQSPAPEQQQYTEPSDPAASQPPDGTAPSSGASCGDDFGGVQPHVAQAGCDIQAKFGLNVDGIGYSDYHADGLALDIWTSDTALGNQVVDYLWGTYSVNYTIWQQNYRDFSGYTYLQPATGNPTADHMDHVHVTFV